MLDNVSFSHETLKVSDRQHNEAMFGPGVLAVHGAEHKKQRKLLNSVSSASHTKNMAPIFDKITRKLARTLRRIVGKKKKRVEWGIHSTPYQKTANLTPLRFR
ncbi:hypothetical protein BKA70DRAFT_12376 [Coprinopsis sp. MPI-PUGE-AT-0042]|nr:hypothetical protein BKA70DRAFT_12376 [Coprinopsis sp. MPI-PUGE-AT-0042]